MARRDADRNDEPAGRLRRAWRWLQSSGYYDDDLAGYGAPREGQSTDRFVLAVLTQFVFWRTNR
jgi:hypothetical protein